jgi:hypothetical protein
MLFIQPKPVVNQLDWKPWRTIILGQHANNQALFNALRKSGYTNYLWTDDIINKLQVVHEPRIKELYLVSPRDLGITYGCDYPDLRTEAMRVGFKVVPTETVGQLRLDYNDQPVDERIHVGTVTFPFKGRRRAIFCLVHTNQGKQITIREPGEYYQPDEKFVFCR